jgi:uncharacterized protein (TIGR00266 family)
MGLDYDITGRPDFALLTVRLKAGDKVLAEPSAMASMDTSVKMKTGMKGGLLKSVGRAFGGESFFVNTFWTEERPGEVVFAPGVMGDMEHYQLDGSGGFLLQRGAYVASTEGVEVSGKLQGFKGFFSGEGLVLLRATGSGEIFFSTYGALVDVDVRGGYYVDTGYVVAFEESLQYEITTVPGLGIGQKIKSFLFGGEGLVCRFSGQGKLWLQTRCVGPFCNWIHPFRPAKKGD